MKRILVLVLALVALAAAVVMPLQRERRALPDEANNSGKPFCAPETPCAWKVYQTKTKIIYLNITNTFCDCSPGLQCIRTEDDTLASAYVLRCRTEAEARLIHVDDNDS